MIHMGCFINQCYYDDFCKNLVTRYFKYYDLRPYYRGRVLGTCDKHNQFDNRWTEITREEAIVIEIMEN
jgi:hypothetical protein